MKEFKFNSSSSSKVYTTTLHNDGTATCDCRGWIFSGVNRECTHTRKVTGKVASIPSGKSATKTSKTTINENAIKALTGLTLPNLKVPYFSPMLAQESKKDLIEERYKSKEWVAEEKFDGSRYLCYITKNGNRFFSRRLSVKDGLPVEKSANIPHLSGFNLKEWNGTVLDGEIMPASGNFTDTTRIMGSHPEKAIERQKTLGKMRYQIFDILYYKGTNVMDDTLLSRLTYLKMLPLNEHMSVVSKTFGEKEKRQLYKDVVARGGEGIILKHIQGKYRPGMRDKNIWMKIKKEKTCEVIITGYDWPDQYSINVSGEKVVNKHWNAKVIAALKTSVYHKGSLIEVGLVSGFNEEMRKEITDNRNKYMGRIVEVTHNGILKDRMRHPRFIRFRDDKNKKDCTWKAANI